MKRIDQILVSLADELADKSQDRRPLDGSP